MSVALEAKGITKTFGGLRAVDDVSLTVEEGEIFGIIGPNGAGKTTFQNCLAGTYKPTSGQFYFFGQNTTGLRADIMCKRGLSRTFQISQPFPKLTALENVLVAATFGNKPGVVTNPTKLAEEMLDYVDFPLHKDTPAQSLNTVQLKRLDLARALASHPRLLLLDELAAGLTEGELETLMDIIRRIRESGVTIIMIEHIMHVIMGLCDHLVVIQYGAKIAEGVPAEVARNPKVTEAYLGEEYSVD